MASYEIKQMVLPNGDDVSLRDPTKLPKTTYEWNKEVSFGSSGYLKLGSFPMYDTNITINIDATTSKTYHGTVVIATQNVSTTSMGSNHKVQVYDDPTGVIASSLRVVWTSGSRNYDVYFVPQSWSKNLIHIRALGNYMDGATDICSKQTGTAPDTTDGLEPENILSSKTAASGGTDTSLVTTGEKYTWNNKQNALTRPVTGAAAWTAADVITTTNASSGNVIKASGKTIATSITNVDTTVPTSKAVKTYVDAEVASIDASLDAMGEILENEQLVTDILIETGCKNKIDLSSGQTLDVTGYGIHCWINPASGEIHLDGINANKACTGSFNIQISKTSRMGMIAGEVYHFSCSGYNTSSTTIGVYVYTAGLTPNTQFDSYEYNELAWNSGWNNDNGTTNGGIRLFIREGTVVDNVTLRPMICEKLLYDKSNFFEPFAFPNRILTPAAIKAVNDGTKNLLVLTDTAMTTTSGVTITYKGDGTYSVNGTATADGYFYLARSNRNDVFKVGNVISGCTGGSSTTFYLAISATSVAQADAPITLTSNYSGSLLFSFKSGQSFSNKVIKPMVCTSQDWAVSQEFEPSALPNPTLTPAVIKSVDGGTKNLLCLDIPTMKTINTSGTWSGNAYTNQGVTYTINANGTITTSGTASSSANSVLNLYKFTSSSFLGNTYSFSGCPTGGDYNNTYAMYVTRSPDNLISGSAETGSGVIFSVPSDALYYRILVRKSVNMASKTFKPMICTVSDYNVSKEFVKFASTSSIIHDYIQVSLSSLTWTASASGLYYSSVIPVYKMSEVWMACLAGFASLRATDNITVACRSSGAWSGITLWANANSFVSDAWVTVSLLGI